MRMVVSYLAKVLSIDLCLYTNKLPCKVKLNNQCKGTFNFYNTVFVIFFKVLKRFIKHFQVGHGLFVDIRQLFN